VVEIAIEKIEKIEKIKKIKKRKIFVILNQHNNRIILHQEKF